MGSLCTAQTINSLGKTNRAAEEQGQFQGSGLATPSKSARVFLAQKGTSQELLFPSLWRQAGQYRGCKHRSPSLLPPQCGTQSSSLVRQTPIIQKANSIPTKSQSQNQSPCNPAAKILARSAKWSIPPTFQVIIRSGVRAFLFCFPQLATACCADHMLWLNGKPRIFSDRYLPDKSLARL